jgi:TRAP-type C4-dicarboxylate transport system substrate-binding protein
MLRFFRATMMAASLAAAAVLSGAASAQTLEWRFNNSYAPTRTESGHIRNFVNAINEKAGGKLRVQLLEGGAMGLRDADALRWMLQGTPELSFIWSPFLGRDAPDLASIYVYGLIGNEAEHRRALPAVQAALKDGLTRRDIEVIGFMGLGLLDATLFCRQPVTNLEELKRVKLRVGTRDQIETFKQLGVAAQFIAQNELYAAMQTGVVDCALYPPQIAHTISLQEVAKHAVSTGFPFAPTPYAMIANKQRWAALPADMKAVVQGAIADLEKASFDFSQDAAGFAAAQERLKGQGVTFHPPLGEADRAALRAAALKSWETIMAEAGPQAVQYRQSVLRALNP